MAGLAATAAQIEVFCAQRQMMNTAANESWQGAVGAFRLLISGHAADQRSCRTPAWPARSAW
jgi:hypothetical protein